MFPEIFPCADGESLTIRVLAPHELPALVEFITVIHESPALGAWARDALSGLHPEMTHDCALVAVTPENEIVGSVVLIPQRWQYGPVTLPVGQFEAIGVAPAYRRRGLAHALMDAAHRLSAGRDHVLQAVVGAPNLYRRFGYTYALRFRGGRTLDVERMPHPDADLIVRPAEAADCAALVALSAAAAARLLLRPLLDETRWEYDLAGHSPDSDAAMQIDLVCTPTGTPIAYARSFPTPWDGELVVTELALQPGAAASVAAALLAGWRTRYGDDLTRIAWELDPEHPLFGAFEALLSPPRRPSAWYLRTPDLPALLAHLLPAFRQRLAAAQPVDVETLTISMYGAGITLTITPEALTAVPWEGEWHEADAALPPDALLMLVMGYRGLDALLDNYPDVLVSPAAAKLLAALFPPQESQIVPLG